MSFSMQFECPYCQQHLEADDSFAGSVLDCPTCGKAFIVGRPQDAQEPQAGPEGNVSALSGEQETACSPPEVPSGSPAEERQPASAPKFRVVSRPSGAKAAKGGGGRTGNRKLASSLHDKFNDFTGLEKIEGFNLSDLLSEIFGKHKPEDIEEFFTVGTPRATPPIGQVDTSWPKPWLFFRALAASIALYLAFNGAYEYFGNVNLIPGMMLMGTLAVPFSTLLFFYEANVRQNVSLYQILRLVFTGGILSLLISLVFYGFTSVSAEGIVAEALPGPVEEAGKLLALVLMARSARYHYKLNGMLMGAAIGTGFAIFESMGYALSGLLEGVVVETLDSSSQSLLDGPVVYMRNIIFLRGVLSPLGHIVWTAIAGAALWRVKGKDPFRMSMLANGKFWHLFLISVVLHSLWDVSIPFLDKLPYCGKYLLLGFVAWFVVIALVQEGLKELRAEKLAVVGSLSIQMEHIE